jgi:hypothetical protein
MQLTIHHSEVQGIRVLSLSGKIIAGSEWHTVRSTDLLTYERSASSIRTTLEILPLSASARKKLGPFLVFSAALRLGPRSPVGFARRGQRSPGG